MTADRVPEPQGLAEVIAAALGRCDECETERCEYVYHWPEDERDLYRNGEWRSFLERSEAIRMLRDQKRAAAIGAWLRDRLGREDVREAVAQAVADIAGLVNHRAVTTAVLAAIPEALGAGEAMTVAEERVAGCDCASIDGGHPGDCGIFATDERTPR